MAQFGQDLANFNASATVKIVSSETVETYTVYIIEVNIGPYIWTVRHRYSDFHDLHEKLVTSRKLDKNLLPPKKVFGNQSEAFIKKRQNDLEAYLQTVLYFVADKPPSCLAAFLDFSLYEIHGITQVMAEELYNKGDLLLQTREIYRTTPLQLYALTERLKLPEPTCESGDVKRDIGHILDFITRLKHLQICGGKPVGTSDIDMNQLKFDLTLFKSVQILELLKVDVSRISGVDTVKETLQRITVNHSASAIRDLLLQDIPHWKAEDGSVVVTPWEHIRFVDFSRNSITEIDDSIQLLPRTVELNLSHNKIQTIQHLQHLSHMTYLDLSNNAVDTIEALHSKLGNLKTLNLAGNKLQTLKGLTKMFSLETLDISNNQVSLIEEVKPISGLPCLENLLLLGNPVTITLDYRTKTLAMFGDRVNEICLDGDKPSQKELDTVAVLQAIQKSKDKAKGVPVKKTPRNASSNSLSMSQSPCTSASLQSSGNQVRKSTPLMQRYNLYNRLDKSSSRFGVLESCSSNTQGSITSPVIRHKFDSLPHQDTSDWTSLLDKSQIGTQSDQDSGKLTDSKIYTGSTNVQNRISPQQDTALSSLPSASQLINVTKLPTHRSDTFSTWLHTRLFGIVDSSVTTTEKIVFVLWCQLLQYSSNNVFLPACVILTQRRLFILQLKSTMSSFEDVPELETFYILPLSNIQQVLVGLCYSYVRVEESFIGAPGTFAFLTSDSDVGKDFYEELIATCEVSAENGMLDVKNLSQNSDLSKQIFDLEEENGMCKGRIAFATHIRVAQTGSLMYLVLSENQVYIIKSESTFWPKPTFDVSSLETEHKFEIAQQFSVDGKISEIETYSPGQKVKKNPQQPLTPTHNIEFEEFGLSMMFHELLGSHKFDFLFLSSKARDYFLDRLTTLRSEHAHRMSPTIREEPEGGNESSDSDDVNGQSNSSASRRKVDKQGVDIKTDSNLDGDDNEDDDEYLSAVEASEITDRVQKELDIKPPRKLRSKTEVIITKPPTDETETHEIPNYTWHYLSQELIGHLTICVQQYSLLQPLSLKLKALTEMTGETVARYFHENVVPIGIEGEELHHILWTNVIPYTNPSDEIITCVMLSNRAVYLVSDRVMPRTPGRPSWMTHARHSSDSIIGLQAKMADKHHSSGILHKSEKSIVKPYCILEFSQILQVNVGLFDQCIRLTGDSRDTVFTFLTRSSELTSVFMKNLSSMLSLFVASPMLDKSSSDLEQDFYKEVNKRTKTTMEGLEYIHPSKVKFCYPGDEAVADLLFIINEHLKSVSLKLGREHILSYILGYRVQSDLEVVSPVMLEPISIILTNDCLCFVTEDLVSYPLPDFVRGLPATPRQHVSDTKKVEYLKYIKHSKMNPREITLVFSDEKEDIIIVQDHYSLQEKNDRDSPPEIPVRVLIQSERELNKFLLLLRNQWGEKHQGISVPIVTI